MLLRFFINEQRLFFVTCAFAFTYVWTSKVGRYPCLCVCYFGFSAKSFNFASKYIVFDISNYDNTYKLLRSFGVECHTGDIR